MGDGGAAGSVTDSPFRRNIPTPAGYCAIRSRGSPSITNTKRIIIANRNRPRPSLG
jgi:hypothetical protein